MNYQESQDYLDSLTRFGIKLGLKRMRILAERLGNPQDQISTVHITGTSGKGSTCEMIGRILTAAGFRTGVYGSPHVFDISERFRIDGECISHVEFAHQISAIRPYADSTFSDPDLGRTTVFEILTLAAFRWFQEKKVDFSVLEVGLGGTHDATNIIKNPKVCGIVSVSLDHTDRLGNTLEEIARDKSGIVKPNGTLVTGADQPEVLDVISQACQEKNARLLKLGTDFKLIDSPSQNTFSVECLHSHRKYEGLTCGLRGDFQKRNAAVAVQILDELVNQGYSISENAVREGLAKAHLPGRLEVICREPQVVLDGAHNSAKAQVLAESIQELFEYDRLILILGILSNHSAEEISAQLGPLADVAYATSPDTPRARKAEDVAESLSPYCSHVSIVPSVPDAYQQALSIAEKRDLVLVTGSFYTIGEVHSCDKKPLKNLE